MTAQKLRRTEQHEVTPGCGHQHCHIHEVDEDDRGAYLACGECGHVYLTARSLRKAYRRVVWQMMRSRPDSTAERRPWFSDEWQTGIIRHLWMLATVRASRLTFCQECIHDF